MLMLGCNPLTSFPILAHRSPGQVPVNTPMLVTTVPIDRALPLRFHTSCNIGSESPNTVDHSSTSSLRTYI